MGEEVEAVSPLAVGTMDRGVAVVGTFAAVVAGSPPAASSADCGAVGVDAGAADAASC